MKLWREIRDEFLTLSAAERKRLFNRIKIAGPRLDYENARWDELEKTVALAKADRWAIRTLCEDL